jgi:replicative superfamily II helicase
MSMPYTDLIDLIPLPITALADVNYQKIYQTRFKYFNPIQTQLFHILYHSDCPVLLGAPTGSGKTTIAEIAIMVSCSIYLQFIHSFYVIMRL